MNKFYSLQILRAFAAWLVVFHHYMQIFYDFESETFIGAILSSRGGFGVDLFFVLSGLIMYLITKNDSVTAASFFVKRVIRVAPAYWFYTLVLIFLLLLFPKEFSFTDFDLQSLIQSYLFIPSQNPSGIGLYPFLTVGWTLILEMAFYTILAVSIFISKKHAIVICSLLIILSTAFFPDGNLYSKILGSKQICQFLFGFLIGFYFTSNHYIEINKKISVKIQSCILILAAAIILFGTVKLSIIPRTLAASCIILSCLLLDSKFSYTGWLTKFIIKSGNYSYSIYLNHILVLGVFLHYAGNDFTAIEELGVITVLFITIHYVSLLSYTYIENGKISKFVNKTVRQKIITSNI